MQPAVLVDRTGRVDARDKPWHDERGVWTRAPSPCPAGRHAIPVAMTYRPLDEHGLKALLGDLPDLRARLGGAQEAWRVSEVGDGNLNLVFIVEGADDALIVKQALPHLRIVGESWPLPLARAWYEQMALKAQAEAAPGLLPKIHFADREMALTVMEYLRPHVIVRKHMIAGVELPRFADDVARFLAQTLFRLSPLGCGAAAHKARVEAFAPNVELCRITEDLVFTDPYRVAKLNRWTSPQLDDLAATVRADSELKRAAQERKFQFLTCAQALIHGDLHTGSIMATVDDTRVIDPEFGFVGPMGFDIGAMLGNLLLAYFSQEGHETSPGERDLYRVWLLDQLVHVWNGFAEQFLALWRAESNHPELQGGECFEAELFADAEGQASLEASRQAFLRTLFEDSLAFAGAKMIRRVFGLAHVADLESITNSGRRAVCETRAVALARTLLVTPRQFSSIEDVADAAALVSAVR
ncbi:MAG: mtnK [Rhodospirillales bacterium]|nr:mtnK [Rhodospirillales bacterium]